MRTRRWIRECRARRSRPRRPRPASTASLPVIPIVEAFRTEEEDADLLPRKQYCVFRAGRERFCFAVLDVEEVIEWPKVTALPLGPPFLMGIFNLRGLIIPVIDIGLTESRRAGFFAEVCGGRMSARAGWRERAAPWNCGR